MASKYGEKLFFVDTLRIFETGSNVYFLSENGIVLVLYIRVDSI